jgi:hypothetical protein
MRSAETSRDTLWTLFAGPTIWVFHFLFSYVTAAVFCAKAGLLAELLPARLWIFGYTALALLATLGVGVYAWWQSGFGEDAQPPHDADTTADRRRFLGYATLLLCGLSFVAIIYGALPALLIETCR